MTTTIIVKEKVVIPDTRADWPEHIRFTEDSELWSRLLTLANTREMQLYRNLKCFRVEGTKIAKLKNGNFGLRPIVRPPDSNNPDEGWRDEADYKQCSKKYLAPYHELLLDLLGELKRTVSRNRGQRPGPGRDMCP